MATCPFCAESIEPACRKCPHCGETLVDRADLVARLADVAPDATFAEQVRTWPDDSLVRALRDHVDDYEPPRQRALLDEVRRRGLPLPHGGRLGFVAGVGAARATFEPARSGGPSPMFVGYAVLFLLAALFCVLFA